MRGAPVNAPFPAEMGADPGCKGSTVDRSDRVRSQRENPDAAPQALSLRKASVRSLSERGTAQPFVYTKCF